MSKAKFTKISQNEIRLDYMDHKFLLIEQKRGFFSAGMAVQLFLLEGFEKKHLKELGWTKSDGSCKDMERACITHITTMDECKIASLRYIDSIV